MNLGTAMAGAGGNRAKDDFYPTPAEVTEALLNVWTPPASVWEPACGKGDISEVLKLYGHEVTSTDSVDRGYGQQADFLATTRRRADCIITNPPFCLAEEFIRHAQILGVDTMALLLKSTYWHATTRTRLFREWQPSHIYALTWRPDFRGQGAPVMECAWFVWEGNAKETTYNVLPRPSGGLFRPVMMNSGT